MLRIDPTSAFFKRSEFFCPFGPIKVRDWSVTRVNSFLRSRQFFVTALNFTSLLTVFFSHLICLNSDKIWMSGRHLWKRTPTVNGTCSLVSSISWMSAIGSELFTRFHNRKSQVSFLSKPCLCFMVNFAFKYPLSADCAHFSSPLSPVFCQVIPSGQSLFTKLKKRYKNFIFAWRNKKQLTIKATCHAY